MLEKAQRRKRKQEQRRQAQLLKQVLEEEEKRQKKRLREEQWLREKREEEKVQRAQQGSTCFACGKTFQTAIQLTMHIESACCHNRSRADLRKFLSSLQNGLNTENHSSPRVRSMECLLDNHTHKLAIIKHSAASGPISMQGKISIDDTYYRSAGGKCGACFTWFKNARALEQHMNSPVHDPKSFKCPQCKKGFNSCSALLQHVRDTCMKVTPSQFASVMGWMSPEIGRGLR